MVFGNAPSIWFTFLFLTPGPRLQRFGDVLFLLLGGGGQTNAFALLARVHKLNKRPAQDEEGNQKSVWHHFKELLMKLPQVDEGRLTSMLHQL